MDLYENVILPKIPSPEKPIGLSTWHESNEFMRYNLWGKNPNTDIEFSNDVRKHYAACVSYADAQVGKIIDQLQKSGQAKNTLVILWGDHGWNLGDHGIWGKHNLFEEGLHSPLIIVDPNQKNKGLSSKSIVETVDVFPTLCELTGAEIPNFVDGKSLVPFLNNPKSKSHIAYAYNEKAKTIRTEMYRFILHQKGEVELYNHVLDPYETKNIAAQNPKKVLEFTDLLQKKRKN
jgi:iduronate 2-sulfatase